MNQKRSDSATRKLICPSCGRLAGSGANDTNIIVYIGITWCARCARVRRNEGSTYVDQPSPGQMIEGSNVSALDSWMDCFQMRPKRRMLVNEAKAEIQRAWDL